jgi:hypothetical protein
LETAGAAADGNVTLMSLTVFQTHKQVLNQLSISSVKERRYLPDVRDNDHLYKFVGQESWQVTPGTSMCFFSENVFFDTLLALAWFSNEQEGTWHINLFGLNFLLFR